MTGLSRSRPVFCLDLAQRGSAAAATSEAGNSALQLVSWAMLNCFRWIHFKDKRNQNHWIAFKTAEGQGGADLNLQIVSQTTLRWVCEKKWKSRLCCFLRLLSQWRTATDWRLTALFYSMPRLWIILSYSKLLSHALNCPLMLLIARSCS